MRSIRGSVSTDHGLDQEFNSLDAQYEAASAYIKSQAHAGWTMIRARYDDGGYSGGSTDRPDLQRLLDDIQLQDAQPIFDVQPTAANSSGWLDKLKNDVFVKIMLLVGAVRTRQAILQKSSLTMDAFEQVVSESLWRKGYWVRTSIRVDLTKKDTLGVEEQKRPFNDPNFTRTVQASVKNEDGTRPVFEKQQRFSPRIFCACSSMVRNAPSYFAPQSSFLTNCLVAAQEDLRYSPQLL